MDLGGWGDPDFDAPIREAGGIEVGGGEATAGVIAVGTEDAFVEMQLFDALLGEIAAKVPAMGTIQAAGQGDGA